MAIGEARKIILRGVTRRAVETFLLVLGLSLGIGASASGVALVSRTIRATGELLASPEYREIIVSTRGESEEMDTAVRSIDGGEDVVLTSIDLAAADDAPDVEYAYIKQPRVFRNAAPFLSRLQQQQGGAGAGGSGRAAREDSAGAPETDEAAAATDEAAAALARLGEVLDFPEPAVDEWYGYAVSPEFFAAWGLVAAAGDVFTLDDIESGNDNVMVLGSELARTLYDDGRPLGRKLIHLLRLVTITAYLEPTGTEIDRLAFVPAFMPDISGSIQSTEIAALRGFWNSDLSFMVADSGRLDEAAAQLRAYFDREYRADAVVVSVPREEAEAARDRNNRLTILILFLGVSGLFIAGVNVSNILLSRALRRQKTVGILKALGASRRAVFRLFFSEALGVGTAGTAVGILVAVLLSRLMEGTVDVGHINPVMLAVGLGASWVVTSILTVFPAMQAARMPAAEAMRTE